MHITVSGLVAIAAIACFTYARADTAGSVTAVTQPVLIQLDDIESELDRSNDISIDDRIVSGAGGRAEIQLWSDVTLRLYPESEVLLRQVTDSADTSQAPATELFLQRGRICLQSGPPTSTGRNFRLNIASGLLAMIHQSAHVCAQRSEGQSALGLFSGSVQLSNTIEPAIVILSEPGFEFVLADDGSYQLLPPGNSESVVAIDEQPFIVEQRIAAEAETGDDPVENTAAGESGADASEEPAAAPEPALAATTSVDENPYVYTVYVFSTRSEEVANEVNRELQQAGHDTRIIVNTRETPARYRVAVSGFDSRQDALEFSQSIVGSHGIRDTWIGRDRQADED